MPKKHNMTAIDIERDSLILAGKLAEYSIKPDETLIIALGRGGMIPAQYVAYNLGIKDVCLLGASSYEGDEQKEEVDIEGSILINADKHRNVIIIDDLVDTGKTLKAVIKIVDEIAHEFEEATEKFLVVIPAVLYTQKSKKATRKMGVVYAEKLRKHKGKKLWVEFPWDTIKKKANHADDS